MNIHCQPRCQSEGCRPCRAPPPETGEPIMLHRPGIATMKERQRSWRGTPRSAQYGQIQNDAGEESGLCRSKQKPQHQKRGRPADQRKGPRGEAPGDHNASDPFARAEAFQSQIARHFKNEITDEENSGAKTVGLRIDANRFVHLQSGKADIHPVDIANDISRQQKWHQPPGDGTHGPRFQCFGGFGRG